MASLSSSVCSGTVWIEVPWYAALPTSTREVVGTGQYGSGR